MKPRSRFPALGAVALTSLSLCLSLGLIGAACGKKAVEPDQGGQAPTDEELGPYPNIKGGEGRMKGDNNFAELINKYPQGRGDKGWVGSFWPYTSNGIASGLYGGGSNHGGGQSPAGKYDAARGGKPRSQEWEVKNHGAGVPKVQGWWGHCNGWCAASSLLIEPTDDVKVNGISFSIADIKGLLSEVGMSVDADFFGNRIDPWTYYDERRWEDTVPDQYFLVLTNYVGKAGRTVLLDRYAGDQVWNQPLAGYRIHYPKPSDYLGCAGGVCKINISSTLWWYNDSGVPAGATTPEFNWKREWNGSIELIQERELAMEIWVDAPIVFDANGKITSSGNVIVTHEGDFYAGGAWKTGYHNVEGHPDYMWVPYSFLPADPKEDYANPEVDMNWVSDHILVPGGKDDPTVTPVPIQPAPSPKPSPSPSPSGSPSASPRPTPTATPIPIPFPTATPTPRPTPRPAA